MVKNNHKKPAMALILLIMIATAAILSVMLSIKVLTRIVDDSVNTPENKTNGVAVCYGQYELNSKGNYELKLKSASVNCPDGNCQLLSAVTTDSNQCNLVVPSGVVNIKVHLIGGGTSGYKAGEKQPESFDFSVNANRSISYTKSSNIKRTLENIYNEFNEYNSDDYKEEPSKDTFLDAFENLVHNNLVAVVSGQPNGSDDKSAQTCYYKDIFKDNNNSNTIDYSKYTFESSVIEADDSDDGNGALKFYKNFQLPSYNGEDNKLLYNVFNINYENGDTKTKTQTQYKVRSQAKIVSYIDSGRNTITYNSMPKLNGSYLSPGDDCDSILNGSISAEAIYHDICVTWQNEFSETTDFGYSSVCLDDSNNLYYHKATTNNRDCYVGIKTDNNGGVIDILSNSLSFSYSTASLNIAEYKNRAGKIGDYITQSLTIDESDTGHNYKICIQGNASNCAGLIAQGGIAKDNNLRITSFNDNGIEYKTSESDNTLSDEILYFKDLQEKKEYGKISGAYHLEICKLIKKVNDVLASVSNGITIPLDGEGRCDGTDVFYTKVTQTPGGSGFAPKAKWLPCDTINYNLYRFVLSDGTRNIFYPSDFKSSLSSDRDSCKMVSPDDEEDIPKEAGIGAPGAIIIMWGNWK